MHPKVTVMLRNKWTIPVVGSAVSFGVGVAVGYFYAKKRLEEDVVVLIEDTTQLTFTFEEESFTEPSTPTFVINEEAWTSTATALEEEGGEESLINVFTATDEDWDYEIEIEHRDPAVPYVIHRDEFFGDEMGWDSQSTLTYYAGDHVLCDERDEPLMNPGKIVGFLRFGIGSGDPNICYIRNEVLQAEYEVLQDPGSYEIDVLGLHVETQMERDDIRHARSPGKFPRE